MRVPESKEIELNLCVVIIVVIAHVAVSPLRVRSTSVVDLVVVGLGGEPPSEQSSVIVITQVIAVTQRSFAPWLHPRVAGALALGFLAAPGESKREDQSHCLKRRLCHCKNTGETIVAP